MSDIIVESDDNDDFIRCDECNELFNVFQAEIVIPTLPNTLTDLPDYQTPRVVCPFCGIVL